MRVPFVGHLDNILGVIMILLNDVLLISFIIRYMY
jgi:hypothetical protein